jgi:hypothetical protein
MLGTDCLKTFRLPRYGRGQTPGAGAGPVEHHQGHDQGEMRARTVARQLELVVEVVDQLNTVAR